MKQIKFKLGAEFHLSPVSTNQLFEFENNSAELVFITSVKEDLVYELHLYNGTKIFKTLDKHDEYVGCVITSSILKAGITMIQLRGVGAEGYAIESNLVKISVKPFINAEDEPTPEEQSEFEKLIIKVNEIEVGLGHKADRDELPTKTSELENDSDFATNEHVEAVAKSLKDDVNKAFEEVEKKVNTKASKSELSDAEARLRSTIDAVAQTKADKTTVEDVIASVGEVVSDLEKETASRIEAEAALSNEIDTKADKDYLNQNYYDKESVDARLLQKASTGDLQALNTLLRDEIGKKLDTEEFERVRDLYVKSALVDNSITLTDEEKLAVEEWLGLSENYLTYYNQMPYRVEHDYNPAHKKYVDDAIAAAGGGSGYTAKRIFTNSDSTNPTSKKIITLSEPMTNFDALELVVKHHAEDYGLAEIVSIDTFKSNIKKVTLYIYTTTNWGSYRYVSDTELEINASWACCLAVNGIKYGRGGGGSSVTMTDNIEGGVDLTVNDITKTLAKEEDLTQLNENLSELPTDVQINGTSILDENKVANIPIINYNTDIGLFYFRPDFGFSRGGAKGDVIYQTKATSKNLIERTNNYNPLVSSNYDEAVRLAMCDGKGAEWTDAEKANARARMGVGGTLQSFYDQTIQYGADGLGQVIMDNYSTARYDNPLVVACSIALYGNTALIYGIYRPQAYNSYIVLEATGNLKRLIKTGSGEWSFGNFIF